MKKIGLLGLTFSDSNKGCMALAYSFYNILNELYPSEKLDIVVFSDHKYSFDHIKKSNINLFTYNIKNISSILSLNSEIKKCDIFFDFTEGDSFTDIYGLKRFFKFSFVKWLVLKNKKSLVLCPQTYGPFNSMLSKKIARNIIKKAKYICTRDVMSTKYIKQLTNLEVDTYTDIAFVLPCKIKENLRLENKIKVGININALLCNGGYNSNNQFQLKTNYLDYLQKMIEYLIGEKKYHIYLIPHVYSDNMPEIENDFLWCKKIKEIYPVCEISKQYFDPMEIKGVISQMDVFIGARMHSTIAAFSTYVPVIPFSYSRKFEGLFESLDYDYVIKAREWKMDKSLKQTINYLDCLELMKEKETRAMKTILKTNEQFVQKIRELISNEESYD